MKSTYELGKIYRAKFPNGDVLTVKATGGEHFRFLVIEGSVFIETLEQCISVEEITDELEIKKGGVK